MPYTITILLATYNGEKFLSQQLNSLLLQTYQNFLIYISDDNSNDSTTAIINDYVRKNPNKIILLDNNKKGGPIRNFLYLLDNVNSDLYLFCDQDDVWTTDHVEELVKKYDSLSHAEQKLPILIHSDLSVVDRNLNIITKSYINFSGIGNTYNSPYFYFLHNDVTGCTTLINQSLKKYVFMNKNYLYEHIADVPMHDWLFALIASQFGKVYLIKKPLIYYRQHGSNVVGASSENIRNPIYFFTKRMNVKFMRESIKYYKNLCFQTTNLMKNLYKSDFTPKTINILSTYINLSKKNKFYRIYFLFHYNFLNNSPIRILGQILFI